MEPRRGESPFRSMASVAPPGLDARFPANPGLAPGASAPMSALTREVKVLSRHTFSGL